MSKALKTSQELIEFINASPSCFHVIENIRKELKDYTELKENEEWDLKRGEGYYVIRNSSSLISFRIPASYERKSQSFLNGFRICAAHCDSPTFKIKPNAEITIEDRYKVLNVEKYGGMLMSAWMDRPLSVAGRIFCDSANGLTEKLVNIDRDLLIIPNVAIHMNRDANDGYKFNPAKDMRPLFTSSGSKGDSEASLLKLIADEACISPDQILGTDLFLYNRVKGTFLGADNEMIASRSLDDLQCVYGLVKGFIDSGDGISGIPVLCIFDNEEVGSLTAQGADSTFLYDVLNRISSSLVNDSLSSILSDSFMISADNAHALHPNHPEYADPTNRPHLNGGIVIKFNANQKYTTNGKSEALIRKLCKDNNIPVQTYANRSDIAGGSTLGNLSNRHVSISTVDIGLPQLSMHSSYETAGAYDTQYLIDLAKAFLTKTMDGLSS